MTMFCEFTPQHGASGWSEMAHTSGVAHITKKKGVIDHNPPLFQTLNMFIIS